MATRTETESKKCLRSWIRFNPPGSRTGIDYYNDYVSVFMDKAIRRAKFDTIVPEFGYEGFHNLWVNGVALGVAREYVNDNIPKGRVDEYYAKYAAKYPAPIVEEALAYLIYENEYIEVDGCWVYPADSIEVPPVKLSLAEWVRKNPPYGMGYYAYYRKYEEAFEDAVGQYTFNRFVECNLDCEIRYLKDEDCFVYMKKEKPKQSQFTSIDLVAWITENPRGEMAMGDYYEKYIKAFGEKAIDLNLFMKLLEFNELVQRVNSMNEKPKETPKEEKKEIPTKTWEEFRYDMMGKIISKPKKIVIEDPSERLIEKCEGVDPKYIEVEGVRMSHPEFMQWVEKKARTDFTKWFYETANVNEIPNSPKSPKPLMSHSEDGMVNAVPADTRHVIISDGRILSSAEFGHLRVVQEPEKPESGNSKESDFEVL